MNPRQRLFVTAIFAAAMAWVESAVVVYLRTLIGRSEPYQPNPLPVSAGLGEIELVREAATLIMLLTVGWLAGQTWRSRLAYAMAAFGIWDMLYYVFLIPMSGWPRSLMDWDILFLLPLPWWGPVLAPVLIALVLTLTGAVVTLVDTPAQPFWPSRRAWALCLAGCALALAAFMADALQNVASGAEAVRTGLPLAFNWPLFALALALVTGPLVDLLMRLVLYSHPFPTEGVPQCASK